MVFVISSGTEIFEIVERRESAGGAVSLLSELLARRRPNVRVADRSGVPLRVGHLKRLAEAERGAGRAGRTEAPSSH